MKNWSVEARVGVFVFIILLSLAWLTLRISDRAAVGGTGYEISFNASSASGLKAKAPVELAGVSVGLVKEVELGENQQAKVVMELNDNVKLPADSKVILRTRGFLGETYVEIVPGQESDNLLKSNGTLQDATRTGDVNSLVSRFNEIADDVKEVSGNARSKAGSDPDAPVNQIIANLQEFTRAIKDVTVQNSQNIDKIATNLAVLNSDLKEMVQQNREDVRATLDQVASITGKIDRGEGTLGKLVNDETTVDKINDSLDGLNDTLGGFSRLQTELGFHTEYLGKSKDFKNYVSLALNPSPDKALLIDVSTDPDPNADYIERTVDVTAGGVSSTVSTNTATVDRNQLLFSAQLAKRFYDLQLRGGIIESTGGVGIDYVPGLYGLHFSAFDFSTRNNQKPHLKLLGDINLTKNLYLLGGLDDMLNPTQKTDWFVGAGFKFVDDDIKRFAAFGGGKSLTGK